jgi:ATP-dependent Zn protease
MNTQASLKASRENRAVIDLKTLEWAKDKILMGTL